MAGTWAWLAATTFFIVSTLFEASFIALFGRFSKQIALLSQSTYPFYLLHDVVGATTIRELMLLGANRLVALAAAFLVAGTLAIVVTAYPERWLRSAIRSLLKMGNAKSSAMPLPAE
jgi:hypothetical protein